MKTKQEVVEDIEMTIGALKERSENVLPKTLPIELVIQMMEGIKSNVENINSLYDDKNLMLEYIKSNRN